ncbi:MAG: hypothetical protein U0869_10035 [Chloroflexota bacterium]
MQQSFLILADGAEAANGKIHILGGGVDLHLAQAFPASLNVDIACSFTVAWDETERPIEVELAIVDQGGEDAIRIGLQTVVGRPANARPGQEIRSQIAVKGPFPIPHPGAYLLMMRLGGIDQVPPFRFRVDQVVPPAPPQAPGVLQ